jgi:hypothetical protein
MTVFLTFGDAGYEKALRRIEKEAAASGFFDRLSIRRPSDLGKQFWRKHGEFVGANRRGYGCWIWKPWLIAEQLRACQPGEILVYADAGCTIRARGRRRFDEYCRMAGDSPSGVLGFQVQVAEKCFTKGDAFEALDAWHLKDTLQVVATVVLLRQCENAERFAGEWLGLAENHALISDAPSAILNDPAFVEHRHDQSLFSLLAKLRGAVVIDDEISFDDDQARDFPFHSSRLRGGRKGPFRGLRRDLGVRLRRARHSFRTHQRVE